MERGKYLASLGNERAPLTTPAVLPPSIMPVVMVSGSAYQMGYQYGQQAGQYIEWKKNAAWSKALKELGGREKVLQELKEDLKYVQEYVPETIDGLKGMANGAAAAGYEVTYTDILLINIKHSTAFSSGIKKDAQPSSGGCSIWSAWGDTTRDGKLICGKSSDAEFEPQVAIIAFPDEGYSYLATAPAGELTGKPCMNSKGVFIGASGGFGRRQIDYGQGIPMTCGTQHLLRFSDTASKAKDLFLDWKYPGSTSMHFSDVHGNAFVVEVTAAARSVRKPGDFGETDFLYSTNNYFTDEMRDSIKGEKFIEHGGWLGRGWSISSIPRNIQLWNMLQNYKGEVDLDFAEMLWRFPGNPPPYPLDENAYEVTQGEGWDQKICNLDNRRIGIMLPDNGDKGVAYLCTGPAGRVAYPLMPQGGDWYQIDGTHTFYQIVLASSPEEVVEAAKLAAHKRIASSYHKLMQLNITDPGYSFLHKLYSQTNAEYYEGIYCYNKAVLASRGSDKMLRCLAQAATAFTRSQAHARQLYDFMVPPATTPQDLGLKKDGDVLQIISLLGKGNAEMGSGL